MKYLLDTSTCVAAIREHPTVVGYLGRMASSELAVATMTVAELWFGARKSAQPARSRAVVDALLQPFVRLPFDEAAAEAYADARYYLERRGTPVGERDLIIAATASANGLTVVTGNVGEFSRVPGVRVETWE